MAEAFEGDVVPPVSSKGREGDIVAPVSSKGRDGGPPVTPAPKDR